MKAVTSARGEGTGNLYSRCSSQGVRPEAGSGCASSPAIGDLRSHTARKAASDSHPLLSEHLDCLHHLCLEWIYIPCIQPFIYFVPTSLRRQSLRNHLAQSDLPTWIWISTCFPSWFIVPLLNIAQLSWPSQAWFLSVDSARQAVECKLFQCICRSVLRRRSLELDPSVSQWLIIVM